ncbi:hypothetical protein MRX96_056602 [Rhipicephalus microplus]
MSNVATPSRDQRQFRTVEPRYLDVERVESLASTAALACGVLCVLLGCAVALSAISFYKQQASHLRTQTMKTSRTTPSVRKRAHMSTPLLLFITPKCSTPYVKTTMAKMIVATTAEEDDDSTDQ